MPQRDQPTPPSDPQQIIDEQRREIDRLRDDLRRSEAERQRLRRENEKLKDELEAARRAVYRQAAPFARGTRVVVSKRPGWKAGAAYGRRAHRRRPRHVDDIHVAPLPLTCPHCAGAVRPVRVAAQYHEDVPAQRPLVRRFDVQIGQCTQCGRRVQGRHPLQTSDALGAAAAQLGPQAVAFAVLLNKPYGLPYGKIAALLRDRFALTSRAAAWSTPSTARRGRRSPPMPPCAPRPWEPGRHRRRNELAGRCRAAGAVDVGHR